jgi:predicted nucleic acid-binding protein
MLMVLVVSDATMLIFLAKLDLIDFLLAIYSQIYIPEKVYVESVINGKFTKRLDAVMLEKYVENQKIKVQKVKKILEIKKMMIDFNIHEGEAEAIALYFQINADLLGTDDYRTLKTCKILKIHYFTTPMFIMHSVSSHKLIKAIALEKIQQLGKIGWYKNDILDFFHNEISKMK